MKAYHPLHSLVTLCHIPRIAAFHIAPAVVDLYTCEANLKGNERMEWATEDFK